LENLQIFLSTTNWCGRRFAPGGGPSLITFEIYIYNRLKDRQGIRQYINIVINILFITYYAVSGNESNINMLSHNTISLFLFRQFYIQLCSLVLYNCFYSDNSIYNYVHGLTGSRQLFLFRHFIFIGVPSNNSIYNYLHWFSTIVFIQTIYFLLENLQTILYIIIFIGSRQLFLFRHFIFIGDPSNNSIYNYLHWFSTIVFIQTIG
jgi:hypothetical protein